LGRIFRLENGKTYAVTFDAWSDIDRAIAISIEDKQNGNATLGTSDDLMSETGRSRWYEHLSTVQTKYRLTFTVDAMKANTLTQLAFIMAQESSMVYIDNVRLTETGTSSVPDREVSPINLYPNPAENDLYISGTSGIYLIRLADSDGHTLNFRLIRK
jgi:hypothetical protein